MYQHFSRWVNPTNIIVFTWLTQFGTFPFETFKNFIYSIFPVGPNIPAAAVAKSRQSCLTLCDPIDGSTPGSSVLGILQARILEWVAISLSNAWKWKVKVKSLSRVRLFAIPWTVAYQALPSGISQARVLEWVAIVFSLLIYTFSIRTQSHAY